MTTCHFSTFPTILLASLMLRLSLNVTPADLADMASYGARSFLIGESLMRQENVEDATRSLLADPVPA